MRATALVIVAGTGLAVSACTEQGPVSPSPAASSLAGSRTSARGGGNSPGDKAVTTTIEVLPAAEIYGVGGTYLNGQDGVRSVLTANTCNNLTWGDWQFSTYSSTRRVGHSFLSDSAVPEGEWGYTIPPDPPFGGTEELPTDLKVKCTCEQNLSMLAMEAGQTISCPLLNHFKRATGEEFKLNAGAVYNPGDTTNAQITCSAADGDGCREWDIAPIPNALTSDRAVGRLLQTFAKGKVREVHRGNFYLRFLIHITRPVSG